jgi:phosphate transport system substrate-binding protein
VLEKGAESIESLAALKKADAKAFEAVWKTIRTDGAFIEAGENDNLIVQKLEANPKAFGVFGFSFLEENEGKIKGAKVEGEAPTFETVASGAYKVARPLFIYAKKQHVGTVPGMAEFVAEYTSSKALGEDGYLSDKGLIPLPKAEAEATATMAKDMQALTADKVM